MMGMISQALLEMLLFEIAEGDCLVEVAAVDALEELHVLRSCVARVRETVQ